MPQVQSENARKLAVDFVHHAWLCELRKGLPVDVEDLIGRLCVTAGIIMEDASVGAISVGPSQVERVAMLLRASEVIHALANAASKLESYSHEER